jgi:phage-related tail fiber protein
VFDIKVPMTHIAIGDGGGQTVIPSELRTALVNEVWRVPISSKSVDENNPNWIIFEAVIPANVGGWTIREVGVIGGLNPDNIIASPEQPGNFLLAAGNFPATYKPSIVEGAAKDMVIRMIVEVGNAERVQLTVDPSVVVATHRTVQQMIEAHRVEVDPHGGRYVPLPHLVEDDPHPQYFNDERLSLVGTPEALPDTVVRRDVSGRAQIEDPADTLDIVNMRTMAALMRGYVDSIFVGMFGDWSGMDAPVGWIPAHGQLLNRADYPLLWAFAEASGNIVDEAQWAANPGKYSRGDGELTFRAPDLRGEFRRTLDAGRGKDAGRTIGTVQGDAIRNITGSVSANVQGANGLFINASGAFSGANQKNMVAGNYGGYQGYQTLNFSASGAGVPTAAENRPRNVAYPTHIFAGLPA